MSENDCDTGAKWFELGRELIRHEDELINHRITWFLVIQGFLLTAFVSGVGLFEKFKIPLAHIYIGLGLSAIAFLAIACCFLVRVVTDQAYHHIHSVADDWWEKKMKDKLAGDYPPMRGVGLGAGEPSAPRIQGTRLLIEKLFYATCRKNFDQVFGTHSLPYFVGIVWIVLVVLTWLGIATVATIP